jgi:hypothetical protein
MPNIHFSIMSPPDKHKEIVAKINTWKYDIEGKYFTGKVSPYIAQFETYEVRVPEEIKGEFIRDANCYWQFSKFGTGRNWKMRLFYSLYRAILWFTPYRATLPAKGEAKYNFGLSWAYVLPIGELRRKKVPVRNSKPREVL